MDAFQAYRADAGRTKRALLISPEPDGTWRFHDWKGKHPEFFATALDAELAGRKQFKKKPPKKRGQP